MDKPKLGDVLEKYIGKGLHPFTQFDGFTNLAPNAAMRPDDDHDAILGGRTWEMMDTCPAVRLLIPPETKAEDVLRLLSKLVQWIEQRPDLLDWPVAAAVAAETGDEIEF